MHGLPWITIFWSRGSRFANNFHQWPKIGIFGNECVIKFFKRYLCPWTHNSAKNNYRLPISTLSLRTVFYWFGIVTSLQLICDVTQTLVAGIDDVIFVDCSCTRKLAQRRSSLVNNNREYRFLTTRYSRLSVRNADLCIALWGIQTLLPSQFWEIV